MDEAYVDVKENMRGAPKEPKAPLFEETVPPEFEETVFTPELGSMPQTAYNAEYSHRTRQRSGKYRREVRGARRFVKSQGQHFAGRGEVCVGQ